MSPDRSAQENLFTAGDLANSGCSIVLGPINGLEQKFAADVAELQRDDPLRPVVVLVGETLLRAYLRRRLAEINGPYMNVHIVTPGELALRLGEIPLILAGQKPLPLLADRMLAQEAALSTSTYFDAVAATPGFGQALHRTLVEIRRAGIAPDALSKAAPELARARQARRPRRPRPPPRRAEGRPLRRRRRARRSPTRSASAPISCSSTASGIRRRSRAKSWQRSPGSVH